MSKNHTIGYDYRTAASYNEIKSPSEKDDLRATLLLLQSRRKMDLDEFRALWRSMVGEEL